MRTDVQSNWRQGRPMRALVASAVAIAVLGAGQLVAWRAESRALSELKSPAVEPPTGNTKRFSRVLSPTLELALRDLDGVVRHG
jgi:hypothetical protein